MACTDKPASLDESIPCEDVTTWCITRYKEDFDLTDKEDMLFFYSTIGGVNFLEIYDEDYMRINLITQSDETPELFEGDTIIEGECEGVGTAVAPTPVIANASALDSEIEFTDTHGSKGGVDCTTWATQTLQFSIDGGTTNTPPITVAASPFDVCTADLSSVVSADYNGDLTITRVLEDCSGVGTVSFDIPITSDATGAIISVDGNNCP